MYSKKNIGRFAPHHFSRKNGRGFTLIELLLVIAIIGILSAVVLASLSSTKAKGRVAAAQATMHRIQAELVSCISSNLAVTVPTEVAGSGSAGGNGGGAAICSGGASYVALPATWVYCDGNTSTGCAIASNQLQIAATGDGVVIRCDETQCQKQ